MNRRNWSKEEIENIWNKHCLGSNVCYDVYRMEMKLEEYGNRDSSFGWEIDHIDGNPDNNSLNNLQPLNWKSNLEKR